LPVVACLIGVAAYAAPAPVRAAGPVGTVTEVRGDAQIAHETKWESATTGRAVSVGDRLKTGKGGGMRVVFRDRSVIDLKENTRLAIRRYALPPAGERYDAALHLLEGKVQGRVSSAYRGEGARFRVTSPTATARVIGAEFVLEYDPREATTGVTGIRGRVAVHSSVDPEGKGVVITARQTTTVRRDRAPTPPHEVDLTLFEQYGRGAPEEVWPDDLTWRNSALLTGVKVDRAYGAEIVTSAPGTGERARKGRGNSAEEGDDVGSVVGESPAALGAMGGVDLGVRF